MGWVVRHVLNAADAVVAQSSNTAENARTYHRFRGPIEIIPLGIPEPAFPAASREKCGLSPEEYVMVTIGRVVRRKGLNYLLDAVRGLGDGRWKLVIVGDGPVRTDLEKQVMQRHHWWTASELMQTAETVFPPRLGHLVDELLRQGTAEAR